MAFLASNYLWALPAAAIPLIIYLIFRRRRRDVRWGSMYILRRVLETRRRIRVWLQYLIIALRTLALIALVMAFAGLAGVGRQSKSDSFPAAPAATHRIILLDNSGSMSARFEGGTRLESALSLSRKIIRSGINPGQIDLVPLNANSAAITFDRFPVPDIQMEEKLSACATPSGKADIEAGLRQAADIFRGSPFQRKEIYLLSDFTANNLSGINEIQTMLSSLSASGVTTHSLRYDSPRSVNFAVLDLSAHSDMLLSRIPSLFYVRIGCYGNIPSADTVLTIEADAGTANAKVLREEPLSMTPGEKTIVLPVELPAGRHTITASVRPDDLASDNSLMRSVDVRSELHIAIIQDITNAKGFENPRTWLDLALLDAVKRTAAPADKGSGAAVDATTRALSEARENEGQKEFASTDEAALPCRISIEGKLPEQINADLMGRMDMIIICGVGRISAEMGELLRAYAYRGGLVLLAPQPGQNLADFNASYAALAPAALDEPARKDLDPERYDSCMAESMRLPLWSELESAGQGNLANARFYNWFTLKPQPPAPDSEVLLSLGDGAPLLLERHLGRGGILLWTAGLGQDWHSLVVHPGYPVFLIRLAGLAANLQQFPVNVEPKQPLMMRSKSAQVLVVRPDGKSEIVQTSDQGGRRCVRYEKTDVPGTYDIRENLDGQTPGTLFTVAYDRSDSDLRQVSAGKQTVLEQAAGCKWQASENALALEVAAAYPGPSHVLLMAMIMVVCLIGESALSRWFLT